MLLVTCVLALSSLAFWQGRRRAFALSHRSAAEKMHSRPGYYGMLTALWCAVPALFIVVIWQVAADPLLTRMVMDGVREAKGTLSADQLNLLVNDVRNLVSGNAVSAQIDPVLQIAADRYHSMMRISNIALAVLALSTALVAAYFAYSRIHPALRARNKVERAVEILLTLCSTFAILITIGIVLSVLFESVRFFQQIPFTDFLFGLKWSPARYLYNNWAGLASVNLPAGRKSYLYVNRGLGHIAYVGAFGHSR